MMKYFKVLISLMVFLITLEFLSWVGIKSGLNIHNENLVPAEIRDERTSKILSIFSSWKKNHSEIEIPAKDSEDLQRESSRYDHTGVTTKVSFFSGYDELSPNIDDEFILYGKESGRIKHRTRYKTDASGRRVTGYENVPNPKLNIIFVGCSYTFGEGVSEEETFPAQVGKLLKGARVYNLGVPGSSLAWRVALLMKKPSLLNGIDPTIPSIIVYTYLDDHLRRMSGTSELFHRDDNLYYNSHAFSVENDSLILEDGFDENFWNFRWLAFFYSKTNFSHLTRLELPPVSTSQFELQEKLLWKLEEEIRKTLPLTKKTYLATFPGQNFYAGKLSPFLRNVTFLDYSGFDFNDMAKGHFFLPGDFHPSAKAYEFFSLLLANDLKDQL